jgi:hypothetical protein
VVEKSVSQFNQLVYVMIELNDPLVDVSNPHQSVSEGISSLVFLETVAWCKRTRVFHKTVSDIERPDSEFPFSINAQAS